MELALPVEWHSTHRARHRLVERVVARRSQRRTFEILLGGVVPEPVLAGLVTLDDRVLALVGMARSVLGRRRVATSDVAASSAAPKMEPPSVGREALEAARAARRCREVDPRVTRHRPSLFGVRRPLSARASRRSASGDAVWTHGANLELGKPVGRRSGMTVTKPSPTAPP